MAIEIKVWQIVDGNLEPIEVSMTQAGRREQEDLEKWIKTNPTILGDDILIIGEQVQTKSGPADFLGIDKSGNTVIVELKRDRLPREVLTQAVDYASDIASWDINKLSEACTKFTGQSLEDYLNENFGDINLEDLTLNKTQRILLVGFSIEESLERMIEWLSNNYGVSVNAIVLKYIKTKNSEELMARTMIIPEEIEKERTQKQQRKIPMSDEPGSYGDDELKTRLKEYLSENRETPLRIKKILLPLCLDHEPVKRDEIIRDLIKKREAENEGQAGRVLTTISRELGIKPRDYLRQVIRYEKPNPWEKENYRIEEKYKGMIKDLLSKLKTNKKKNAI